MELSKVFDFGKKIRNLGVSKFNGGLKNRIKSKIMIRTGNIKNKPYNADDAQNDYKYKRAFSKAKYKLDKYPIMKKTNSDYRHCGIEIGRASCRERV